MLDTPSVPSLRCPRLAQLRYDRAAAVAALAEQGLKPALSATFWRALAERLATAAAYVPSWRQRYLRDRARECVGSAAVAEQRERNARIQRNAFELAKARAHLDAVLTADDEEGFDAALAAVLTYEIREAA